MMNYKIIRLFSMYFCVVNGIMFVQHVHGLDYRGPRDYFGRDYFDNAMLIEKVVLPEPIWSFFDFNGVRYKARSIFVPSLTDGDDVRTTVEYCTRDGGYVPLTNPQGEPVLWFCPVHAYRRQFGISRFGLFTEMHQRAADKNVADVKNWLYVMRHRVAYQNIASEKAWLDAQQGNVRGAPSYSRQLVSLFVIGGVSLAVGGYYYVKSIGSIGVNA